MSLNAAIANVKDQLASARSTVSSVAQPDSAKGSAAAKSSRGAKSSTAADDADSDRGGGGGDDGDDAPVQVYCRIRPSRGKAASKDVLTLDPDEKRVEFNLPKEVDASRPNNASSSFKFDFNGLFDESTTQEQLFEGIGKKVVNNVIDGFNGTIFAYGQTGSGKTYSMMGGTSNYEDRGLIPRSLSYIYDWIEKHSSEFSVTVRISYLEIYNDKGYDLLDPQHECKTLEELPRVTLMENDGQIFFRNLGELPASTVDEALNLLFVGDTNRVVCETPSNDASTRSHCIFIVSLEMRIGTKVRRAKLNMVDLAGSERIKKTGVGGKIMNEALQINLSLHHLEQVIVALHDQANGKGNHIPYRNSMLTSVLRDSLGGNCKTVMLATLSPERGHLDESISTSRFAQRVAMIQNRAQLNEEVDPYVMVKNLKAQLREMREEVAALRGQANYKPLEDDERKALREMIATFLRDDHDPIFDEDSSGKFQQLSMPNPYRVRAAFECWKEIGHTGAVAAPAAASATAVSAASSEALARLQRENTLLVDALRAYAGGGDVERILEQVRARAAKGGPAPPALSAAAASSKDRERSSRTSAQPPQQAAPAPAFAPAAPVPTAAEIAMQKLRAESFESFRRSYRKHALVEEQKAHHAAKVEQARARGEHINKLRNEINATKVKIEQHRLARGVETLGSSSSSDPLPPDDIELKLRSRIDSCKSDYRAEFEQLKALKAEIDFLQSAVEKSRRQLQRDFDTWWATQPQSQGEEAAADQSTPDQRAAASQHPHQQATPRLIADASSVASNSYSNTSAVPVSRPRPAVETWSSSSTSVPAYASAPIAAWGAPPTTASNPTLPGGLRTTGNSAADADIAKFYAMKEELMRQQQQQKR